MKDAELNKLLAEVLAPEADEHDGLLQRTLRQSRRRVLRRRVARGVGGIAALLLALGLGWQHFGRERPPAVAASETREASADSAVMIVHTQPTPVANLVETRAGGGALWVVHSSAADIVMIETSRTRATWTEIDDRQLLALVGGHPAILLKRGGERMELVFVNEEDRKKFGLQ